jgi:carboxylesterase
MKQKCPQYPLVVPKARSFLFRGSKIGCLLIHGYTASPEEILPLGEFFAKQGYKILWILFAGRGTYPTDLSRVRYQDWLNSIQDRYFMLKRMTDKVFLIGQSLGAMLTLSSTPEISPSVTIAISTPYTKSSLAMKIVNRFISILFPLMPMWHLRKKKMVDKQKEANYPAYPIVATSSIIEIEKTREKLVKKIAAIRTPVLLFESHIDFSEKSVAQITSRLTNTKSDSIWHQGMDHSMALDQQRQLVF